MFICKTVYPLKLLKVKTDLFGRIQGDVQTAEGCKAIVENIAAKEAYVSSFSWMSHYNNLV